MIWAYVDGLVFEIPEGEKLVEFLVVRGNCATSSPVESGASILDGLRCFFEGFTGSGSNELVWHALPILSVKGSVRLKS